MLRGKCLAWISHCAQGGRSPVGERAASLCWVPVDDQVRHLLDRLVSPRSPLKPSRAVEPSDWLLPRPRDLRASYVRIRRALTTTAQRAGVSLPALKELIDHKSLRMTLRYVQVSQNDLQREFHAASLKLANSHSPLPMPLAAMGPDVSTGLPALSQALAITQHLLEMYRRQLSNGAEQRTLNRLTNRLTKVATELASLTTPPN